MVGRDHLDPDDALPPSLGQDAGDGGSTGAQLRRHLGLGGVLVVVHLGRGVQQGAREVAGPVAPPACPIPASSARRATMSSSIPANGVKLL